MDILRALDKLHLRYQDIQVPIEYFSQHPMVATKVAGLSFEGRPIHLLALGEGRIKVFMWTQMHGDEATATAAVFDLMAELLSEKGLSTQWQRTYQLFIMPMLNPDGAERCIRQNAQAIDINRDAIATQSPEARLLHKVFTQIQPDIALNLHDQSPYYQSGSSGKPATIAFLAPAGDIQKSIPPSRAQAMALIAEMRATLEQDIPKCIARYDDTFSPRSFGDIFAGLGASTILIESGAYAKDPHRQIARAMNVKAIQCALKHFPSIALKETLDSDIQAYFDIPENQAELLSSLLIRNLHFIGQQSYQASVSIKQSTRWSGKFYIDAVGDLGMQAGLEEFDASDLSFSAGRVHELTGYTVITDDNIADWLRQGITQFQGEAGMLDNRSSYHLLYNAPRPSNEQSLVLGEVANFLMCKGKHVVAAVLNGQLIYI